MAFPDKRKKGKGKTRHKGTEAQMSENICHTPFAPLSLCPSVLLFPFAFFLFIWLPTPAAFGQDLGSDTVTLVDVDGKRLSGPLRTVSDEMLRIGARESQDVATSDLLRLQFNDRPAAASLGGVVVFLANGDRVVGRPVSMDADSLVVAWMKFPSWPAVKIPLSAVRGILMRVPQTRPARTRIIKTLLDRRENSDVVILRNGDHVTGELTGLDETMFSLESAAGKTNIDRRSVRAVGFNAELISFPQPEKQRALLPLSDGSRVTACNMQLDPPGVLRLDALFGAKLDVPLSAVVSLHFLGGRAVYLSDLEPVRYQFTEYLQDRWPLRKDRNVAGGPLRLRSREYAKGLGMHSKSEVTYDLGDGYWRFQAVVGVDDDADGQGSVTAAVLLDGKRVFSSGPLTGKSLPERVKPIDVTGARRLTLIVDYGQSGDIRDHIDWCDAVLIKAQAVRTE